MKPTKFGPFTDGFYETGNQVHDWILEKARAHFRFHQKAKQEMTGREDVKTYQARKRRQFLECIGGLPEEFCPLETLETGRLERNGYHVRKLIYQSMPAVYVTANLYVPEGLESVAPGVLLGCGHAKEGKAAPLYQQVGISLVHAGFVVLVIDSPSHGEMLQCLVPETGDPACGCNTSEHGHLQLSASIIGCNIMRYFVWNAMRGLDLLCGLPEVDADRLGMTGNSGGGHLTQAVMMTDDRVKAAMPCCSLTTREGYLKTGIRAYDGEQNLFGCIPGGLDYDDFLAAFAPKPLRIGAAEYDYFAIEGVLEAVERTRRIYALFGAEDKFDLWIAEGEKHAYSAALRNGCLQWFALHLQNREVERPVDDLPVEAPETLRCTATGQVLTGFGEARSMIDLNREARGSYSKVDLTREQLHTCLQLPESPHVLRPRITARIEMDGCTAEHVFFFSEPNITVTAVLYRPLKAPDGAALLLIPDGTEGQEPYSGEISELVAAGKLMMVFDPRGTGAVRMRARNSSCGYAFRSTEFRVASDHFMLGTSLAARRAFDVLRALEYLRTRGGLPDQCKIDLRAYGAPAVWGLIAAAIDGDIGHSSFSGLPRTWAEAFVERPPDRNRISESLILPELDGAFDLPDLLKMVNEHMESI